MDRDWQNRGPGNIQGSPGGSWGRPRERQRRAPGRPKEGPENAQGKPRGGVRKRQGSSPREIHQGRPEVGPKGGPLKVQRRPSNGLGRLQGMSTSGPRRTQRSPAKLQEKTRTRAHGRLGRAPAKGLQKFQGRSREGSSVKPHESLMC